MAGEPLVTIVGNLVADPEARVSQAGKSWVTFRIASTPRVRDGQSGDWSDGEPLWIGCRAYGDYADNIAASLKKGVRVIVLGRLTQRSYTDNQGQQRTSLDLEVEEVGPALRFATASVARGGSGGPAGGGWAAPPAQGGPTYQTQPGGGQQANPWGGQQPQAQQPPAQPQGQQAWGAAPGGFDDEQPF